MKKIYILLFVLIVITSTIICPCYAAESSISWTEDELAFMEEHPLIRLGVDPGFIPFEFIDEDGEYNGIAADYLSLISEKTGLKFEVVKGLRWPEAYSMALEGKVDALPAVGKTEEREKHFLFSQPYYYFKRVIVTRDTDTHISGMKDLEGLTVAVQRYSSHHSYLLSYPHINLSIYDSTEAALTAVATGSEKAFIGNLTTTNYLIRANGLTNLRFVAFEADKPQALYFAVRKDWPELISIINKALNAITENEKLAVNNKWIDLQTDIDYGPIIRVLSVIGAFVIIVITVSFFWIARLRKEIQHRKQVQKDLEMAKREAEEANEFKSSFMARISHEIRTPLNAITGMAYLLKKTDISLTQNMYIDRIMQAANNMLHIINDILDFSKIEAGKAELEITSFSLDQVIQEVVNIISYKVEEQKISFRFSKDPLVPNWFFGDAKRIEQILLNVLNNAVKFTSAGEVLLDIRLLAKENDKYHISFTVKDTGIGMTEEQLNKLFTPFVQGDISINRRFGGSGLGLSIVKNLLDMMGGEIEVFSTPGEGSTFIILLPLTVDTETENRYKKALSSKRLKDIRTLVLGKSGENTNMVESYLSAFGIHCQLTNTEAGALRMLEAADGTIAKPFDLLIIDYDTLSEDGFNFVEAIRSSDKIGRIPKIIMLLPMMQEDLFDKLNEHGIDRGISKPVTPSTLLDGVLDLFNQKAVSDFPPNRKKKKPEKLDESHCVLLVEDNETNQLIAQSFLQQAGIDVISAGDGKEALELYQQHEDIIDLILLDLHMPVMNGYEVARKIRKISADIPIVAITADVIPGVREKCVQNGIYHYISKPFNPDYFIQTVKDLLAKNASVLDQAAGLKNMGGSLELYRKVLNKYASENQDTVDKIRQAIYEKRYVDAAQIVHKIKSSSGSIGAKPLYEVSMALQKALNEQKEEEIPALEEKFSRLLCRLLDEIKKLQPEKG
ncbi:MAG TPA: transporter substrate-binding domain-containing protein [Clostridiaceae bacterium]|nr:transporter substrate-binding domain-containing protein [Clostridiaceae bacterium]